MSDGILIFDEVEVISLIWNSRSHHLVGLARYFNLVDLTQHIKRTNYVLQFL